MMRNASTVNIAGRHKAAAVIWKTHGQDAIVETGIMIETTITAKDLIKLASFLRPGSRRLAFSLFRSREFDKFFAWQRASL
jgi:hypothetical protein